LSTEITNQQIKDFRTATDDKHNNIIRRAVTKNGIHSASFDQEIANINTPIFSIDLDTGKVANQKQSGRCWMFAALNTMRHDIKGFTLVMNFNFPKATRCSGTSLKKPIIFMKMFSKRQLSLLTHVALPSY